MSDERPQPKSVSLSFFLGGRNSRPGNTKGNTPGNAPGSGAGNAAPPAAAPAPTIDELLQQARSEARDSTRRELAPAIAALEGQARQAEQKLQAETAHYRELVAQITTAIEERLAHEVAGLAFAIAETVLKTQPEPGIPTLASLIGQAISGLTGGTLYLNPAAAERAQTLAPAGWAIARREELPAGVVEAETGIILQRADLSERLAQLLEQAR